MAETAYDVVGIGNAIVDVLAHAQDDLLAELGLTKGTMALVDTAGAERVYAKMGPGIEVSGGSAANTIAGIASLGGRGAYMGKVKDDQLGSVFRHDIQAMGVHFPTPSAKDGLPTARCMILVTPDAQRTMNTYLGACVSFGPDDVDEQLVAASSITYLEGYLFDPPQAKEAFRKASRIAHEAGRKVALSLSDPFCVGRHKDEFLALLADHVDILFANEAEITALYGCDFDQAAQAVAQHCTIAALTRGPAGSVVVSGGQTIAVAAAPVAKVEDTTGAGDLYAAGFLHGLTTGRSLAECARLGGIAAAECISHMGPRPQTSLKELAAMAMAATV